MARQKREYGNAPQIVTILAKVTDMLEYACWDYPDDAIEAKRLVKAADELLDKLKSDGDK